MWAIVLLLATAASVSPFGITIERSAYRDVVIEIQDSVPMDQCAQVLNDLEVSFAPFTLFTIIVRCLLERSPCADIYQWKRGSSLEKNRWLGRCNTSIIIAIATGDEKVKRTAQRLGINIDQHLERPANIL